jgi:ATP-dependent exoDNAse (exonuclease V) beta subunit
LWGWLEERLAAREIQEALSRESARHAARALVDGVGTEDAGPVSLEVENELPFLHREGDALMEGVIDRLVLLRDPQGVVGAHVLDYKTDALPSGDEAALEGARERYAPQLRAYRDAVSALYGIPAERVRLTLLFLEPGRAVDVD